MLQFKSNEYYIFWVCVYSLRYPACNARAPYCHLRPARLYIIYLHYLINGTIFGKKSYHHHHHHHIHLVSFMELGHLLTRSGLTYPKVSSNVYHDSFRQLGSSVSLPWVIYSPSSSSSSSSSHLSWSWATCWPVPVSRTQKSLQRSTMIPSASWTVVFHYPG